MPHQCTDQADPLLHSDKIALRPLYAKAQHELFIHGQQDAPRSGSDPPAHARRFKSVDVRHISELTDSQFASEYMAANRPVLIQGAMDSWRATREWVTCESQPDIDTIERVAGRDAPVTVTDTSQQQEGVGPCRETTLGAYLDWWRARGSHNRSSETGTRHTSGCADKREGLLCEGVWYLKDWHFVSQCPDYKAYEVPSCLSSDWLNEHYDRLAREREATISQEALEQPQASSTRTSDYRFVYLGPQGSWTPLHSDVLRSYSWSANVAGKKRWLLLPPEYTYMVYDPTLTTAASDWCDPSHCSCAPGTCPGAWQHTDTDTQHTRVDGCVADGHNPQHTDAEQTRSHGYCGETGSRTNPQSTEIQHGRASTGGGTAGSEQERPSFPLLQAAHQHLYEVIQGPGELLFVPSGWHHTVVNLTDVLSINHNWFNAHNAAWCWALVKATHERATASLEDCRSLCTSKAEWWKLVQDLVAADCGLDLRGLALLLMGVMRRAMAQLGPQGGAAGPDERSSDSVHDIARLDISRATQMLAEVIAVVKSEFGLEADDLAGCPDDLQAGALKGAVSQDADTTDAADQSWLKDACALLEQCKGVA